MSDVRKFETGATRSAETGRDDPEGYISPLVIDRFNEYMTKHRVQPDGSVRASDNWQKGLPLATYAKGLWRHFLHFILRHRGWPVRDPLAAVDIEEDLCAIMFNTQGYLHETIKARLSRPAPIQGPATVLPDQAATVRGPARVIPLRRLSDVELQQEPLPKGEPHGYGGPLDSIGNR